MSDDSTVPAAAPEPVSMESPEPSAEVERAVEPLLVDPGLTAVISDYDGTLSPIVTDPAAARPVEGTSEVLNELARVFGVVAVVSGRPISFLLEQLDGVGPAVRMAGLYGLEQSSQEGIRVDPEAAAWVPLVHEVADRLRAAAPPGVLVEDKHLGVTVHWRTVPDAAAWGEAVAHQEADRTGLRPQDGKMSVELRVPLDVDKGTTVTALTSECTAACYLGDDVGDLPAFAALRRQAEGRDLISVCGAVAGPETPPALLERADVTVAGPVGALALLRWLAGRAGEAPERQ